MSVVSGVTESEITEVTNSVWESMLGLSLLVVDEEPQPDAGPYMTGCVLISGAFEGAVTLECSKSAATLLAGSMFGMTEDELTDSETTDALGELANMVGGNLKALVVQPSKISLPSVAEGDSYKVSIPGTVPSSTVHFLCEGHPVHVTLYVRADSVHNAQTEPTRSVA